MGLQKKLEPQVWERDYVQRYGSVLQFMAARPQHFKRDPATDSFYSLSPNLRGASSGKASPIICGMHRSFWNAVRQRQCSQTLLAGLPKSVLG